MNLTNDIINRFSSSDFGSIAIGRLIPALLTFLLCLAAMRFISSVAWKLVKRSKMMDETLRGFVRSAIKILLWLITALIVADTLGIPTASLVALFSVVGLALSLSVQNIMSNLFSGVTLLMTRPFAVGDFVDIGGKTGNVKSIGLFYTVLDSIDNRCISIPNADVTAAAVINYAAEPLRRVDMHFSASYDDSTQSVKAALLEAAAEDERVLQEPAPFVGLKEYQASSILYTLRIWCNNEDYWDVYFNMNERVRESFKRNGVTMSYEHLNVHITKE